MRKQEPVIPYFLRKRSSYRALAPHNRLWFLRMLVALDGYEERFIDGEFACAEEAVLLGLDSRTGRYWGWHGRQAFRSDLARLHEQAEADWKRMNAPQPASILDTNLDILDQALGWSATERSILKCIVLLNHDRALARFQSYLGAIPLARAIEVIGALIEEPAQSIADALHSEESPLVQSGLVSFMDAYSRHLIAHFDLPAPYFARRLTTQRVNPAELFRDKIGSAPARLRHLPDYIHSPCLVIGIGDEACQALMMGGKQLPGAEFLCIDTDTEKLDAMACVLGARTIHWRHEHAPAQLPPLVRGLLADTALLVIVASLEEQIGSRLPPELARTAHEMGVSTAGVFTLPADWEDEQRKNAAYESVSALRQFGQVQIVTPHLLNDARWAMIRAVKHIATQRCNGLWIRLSATQFVA